MSKRHLAGFSSPVVENQVDTGLGGLLGAFLHLLGGGVAALELHVAERSHLVLGESWVQFLALSYSV